MELALATGKKLYDKRQDLAQKDAKREMDRALKERNRWLFDILQICQLRFGKKRVTILM